ncbi:unnamed protein product [Allacma fusca]|uniref:Uncharacterized protein n=1 Tax=Allacma fusca TaxID=39272 RepID=A0A8J2K195_9HEXA|nr:unnamed protein product [Allacma fusca]
MSVEVLPSSVSVSRAGSFRSPGVLPGPGTSCSTYSPPPIKHDYSFKIITLGMSGVGKTMLSLRYTNDVFYVPYNSTIGLDYSWKSIRLGSKNIFLRVWDTSGQERFGQIIQQYVRKSDGVVLAYDTTNPASIEKLQHYLDFANVSGAENAIKILVGCKADLTEKRQVSHEVGKALAEKLGVSFFETSAKDSLNVEAAFRTLATEILEKRMSSDYFTAAPSNQLGSSTINLTDVGRRNSRKWFYCF